MRVLKVFAFGLMLSTCFFSSQRARAVVLAEDDFSGTGSGTGWAAGNDWEGLGGGIASTNPSGEANVQSFRDFESPIDAANQVTYIRFDYAQTVPGNGAGWGGAAFFEGVEGDAQAETLFVGNSGGATNYAADLKQGDNLISPFPIDDQFQTLIMRVDTTGVDHVYDLWVNNFNESIPSATTTLVGIGPVDAAWGTLRLASDGPNTDEFDNLIIATEATDVGLQPLDATLTVDRASGNITLASAGTINGVVGYTLFSTNGSFATSSWTQITDNYDNAAGPGDGTFDADDDWVVVSDVTTEASEFAANGDGGTLTTTGVDLGSLWERTPFEDVVGTITILDNGEQVELGVNVVYTGDSLTQGDLDGDGDIDADDWASFKTGQGAVNDTMTSVQAYKMGDMDGNLDHTLADFALFEEAYDTANGVGAFAAMVQSVPEPTSIALLVAGMFGACVCQRRRGAIKALLLVFALAVVCVSTQDAKATVFAQDDFSAEGSGTGWTANDDWGNVAGGVGDTAIVNNAFRSFATPLEPYLNDKIYIAFDFKITTGTQWGGVAFFDGVDGGNETLFIGNPSQNTIYGADLKIDNTTLPADPNDGIQVNANSHRLIMEIDFDDDGEAPFDDTYNLWVDDINQNNPVNSVTINNSPVISSWGSVRLGADGGSPIQVDNLIITDDASLVFVQESLELIVNKATGEVMLQNNTGAGIDISAYSIGSNAGMLDVGALGGDFDTDGDVDGADFLNWQRQFPALDAGDLADWEGNYSETGSGSGGWDSLADQDLAGFPAGDGSGNGWEEGGNPGTGEIEEYFLTGESAVGDGTSISLGNAYGGGVAGDEDLAFSYRSGGELKSGTISYINGALSSVAAVPEPASAAIALMGICFLACYRSEK